MRYPLPEEGTLLSEWAEVHRQAEVLGNRNVSGMVHQGQEEEERGEEVNIGVLMTAMVRVAFLLGWDKLGHRADAAFYKQQWTTAGYFSRMKGFSRLRPLKGRPLEGATCGPVEGEGEFRGAESMGWP